MTNHTIPTTRATTFTGREITVEYRENGCLFATQQHVVTYFEDRRSDTTFLWSDFDSVALQDYFRQIRVDVVEVREALGA